MNRVLFIKSQSTGLTIEQQLSALFQDVVVRTASEKCDLLSLVRECSPDVLLLEACNNAGRFTEPVRRMRQEKNMTPVLILNDIHHEELVFYAAECGANGVLSCKAEGEQLKSAIITVMSGYSYFPLKMNPATETCIDTALPERRKPLSAREAQIIRYLKEGNNVTMISVRLGISIKTVNTFIARLKNKLGMESLTELKDYSQRS